MPEATYKPMLRKDPGMYAKKEKKVAPLTLRELHAVMDHDGYRRVKGRIRQRIWASV